jgi:hypothetical protein
MPFIDYRIHFHHPANNFVKGDLWGTQSEHEFGNRFADTFSKSFNSNIIAIRELPVPGSGIADFVVIKPSESIKKSNSKTSVQAFEFKLKNWRNGLMQAHRYKYFSNSSILVMPMDNIKPAQESLDLFKQLGVGLWAFNASSGAITKRFTPRPKKVLDVKRAAYILEKIFEPRIHSCERSL